MITKTSIALAIVLGTASLAVAQEADPNLLNRYPVYNTTVQSGAPMATSNVALGGHVQKNIPQSYIDRASFSTGQ